MTWSCRNGWLSALAGCLASMMFLAGCAGTPERPAYMRIAVSQKSVVCLQFQGDELRAAMSVEALPDAKPVQRSLMNEAQQYAIEMPTPVEGLPAPRYEITLPIPAAELPAGLSAVQASFLDGVVALTLCRADAQNVEWQCRTKWAVYQTSLAAADAPVIALPDASKTALAVTGVPAPGKLGIGLNLVSGPWTMGLKRADGQGIPAQVRLVDETGREIVRKQGMLDNFGFTCDGPCCVARAAKGAYVLEATISAGPFGGTLKAEMKVAVP